MTQFLLLEEKRDQALEKFTKHQAMVKRWFDRMARIKDFRISNLVLCWDKAHEKKGDHDKFDNLWMGPFQIYEILRDNAFKLRTLMGKEVSLLVNG